jgi:hypothetical protein
VPLLRDPTLFHSGRELVCGALALPDLGYLHRLSRQLQGYICFAAKPMFICTSCNFDWVLLLDHTT